jgi:endoglucanase
MNSNKSLTATFETTGNGSGCEGVPVWTSSAIYANAGTMVQYNGFKYENRWYSQGQSPESYSGAWQVWINLGPCSGDNNVQYTLQTSTTGSGSIALNPTGGNYNAGVSVTATATPSAGYRFVNWSGEATGTANPATIMMDGNKSVTAIFEATGNNTGACANPVPVTLPFSHNGVGEFCWVVSGDISYINSWNTSVVEVNGSDFTNSWSNNFPPKIDGAYFIYYNSTVGWAHFEAAGTQNARLHLEETPDEDLIVYPNPSEGSFTINFRDKQNLIKLMVFDQAGRIVYEKQLYETDGNKFSFGRELSKGIYYVRLYDENNMVHIKKIIKY